MKKMIAIGMAVLSVGMLSACSTNSNSAKSSNSSSSASSATRHYKYYAKDMTFYCPKGTVTVNKAIPFTSKRDGKKYFVLDLTFKNTSKKAIGSGDILNNNIIAHQMNTDKSQKVDITDSNSIDSSYFSDDDTENNNKLIAIVNAQANEIMPGKTQRTLQDFLYKPNNENNDVTLSLDDQADTSNDGSEATVDPARNKIVLKMDSMQNNTLNLSDYSAN